MQAGYLILKDRVSCWRPGLAVAEVHCCVVKWGSGMGAVYPGDEYED